MSLILFFNFASCESLTSGFSKTNNAFNQGFTSIVVLCYHAEIIASGLGWLDPILLHCTHQKNKVRSESHDRQVPGFSTFHH